MGGSVMNTRGAHIGSDGSAYESRRVCVLICLQTMQFTYDIPFPYFLNGTAYGWNTAYIICQIAFIETH